jgi:signal transduction histidine kinase
VISLPDSRLERLLGDGATAFREAFDLVPDPVGVLWAIRDRDGAISDFETGYSNPAMARMIGVRTEASMGRRLLEEAPDFAQDETFARMRGVLEYARSGNTIASEAVDTGALLAEVASSLTNAVDELGGQLEIAKLPVVRDDRAQLGRVFQNLVANGLKFHADEPPRVEVSAERREAAWLFSVRDNGVGVPPELGDEIFSMFKRAHGEEVAGSGIGLAVCRKIVEGHGGAIWAEPAHGAGTVMRFTLPAPLCR